MSTADYALIVSIFSTFVALAGFGWNVWSKFIYPKAKLRVTFYVCTITGGPQPWPKFLCASGTNFGPTDVTVLHVGCISSRGRFKRGQRGILQPIADINNPGIGAGPFAGGLPKKLEVGGEHSAYFPFAAQSFGRDDLTCIGMYDNFARFHRAKRRDIAKVKDTLDKAFADEPYVNPHTANP